LLDVFSIHEHRMVKKPNGPQHTAYAQLKSGMNGNFGRRSKVGSDTIAAAGRESPQMRRFKSASEDKSGQAAFR
jgi:hypothetical protein